MTRPIFESHPKRSIGRSKFRDRQLERRPATAAAGDPAPVPWAYMYRTPNLTVNSATSARPFTNGNTVGDENDPSVLEVHNDGTDVWFRFNERGIYELNLFVRWASPIFTGEMECFYEVNDGPSFLGYDVGDSIGPHVPNSETEETRGLIIRVQHLQAIYVVTGQPSDPLFAGARAGVSNQSGSNRTLNTIAASCYQVRPITVDS